MDANNANDITGQFLEAFRKDYSQIQHVGVVLFYYLAVIQLTITALWAVMKSEWPDFFAKILQVLFTFGVFATLIKLGGDWMPSLINTFISIGSSSSGITSLTPGSILEQGLSIAWDMLKSFSAWGLALHPINLIITMVLFITILVAYTFIAADLAIVLIKSYCLISLSGIFFAFGANEVVRPMATNYFKALIGIGLQLLTLYLLLGVGVSLGSHWSAEIHNASSGFSLIPFTMIGVSVAMFYLVVKNIPPFIAGLSGVGGFQSMGEAAMMLAVSSGIQAAGGLKGAGVGSIGAGGIAKELTKSAVQGYRNAGDSGIAKKIWGAAKNSAHNLGAATAKTSVSKKPTALNHIASHMKSHNSASPIEDFKPNGVSKGKES